MTSEDAYRQALDYLYSFVDYSLTRSFRNTGDAFDLRRMESLLNRLGNPHLKFPVVHLAGTKGKGSTAALIASALQAAGHKTGFYTSPHLQEFNERVQVNGWMISNDRLVELVEKLRPHAEALQRITTFELTTALAFLYFAEEEVDIAVVEVGLGGRLDATNLVHPLVSVITSLSMDHMAVLGDTLSKIAYEKAGIIKPGRPVVVAPQKDEALRVVQQVAEERLSTLTVLGHDYHYASLDHSLAGQRLYVWADEDQDRMDAFIEGQSQEWSPIELSIPLLGYHQIENAATAYAALQIIHKEGIQVSLENILAGFAGVFWPGRFEVLRQNPPVIVDSAHNRDSALKLRLALEDYLPGKQVVLLFGVSEDKDVEGIFAELLPRVKRVVATESIHPRAMKADDLVKMVHRYGRPAESILPIEAALERALEIAGNDSAVLVTGSLFIAAGARDAWKILGYPLREFSSLPITKG